MKKLRGGFRGIALQGRWNFGSRRLYWTARATAAWIRQHLHGNLIFKSALRVGHFIGFKGLLEVRFDLVMGAAMGTKRRAGGRGDTRAAQLKDAEMAISVAHDKSNADFIKEYLKPR